MPWPAATYDEDRVKAEIEFLVSWVAREPEIGCGAHSLALGVRNGGFRVFVALPVLDLDEGQPAASQGNEVDLS